MRWTPQRTKGVPVSRPEVGPISPHWHELTKCDTSVPVSRATHQYLVSDGVMMFVYAYDNTMWAIA